MAEETGQPGVRGVAHDAADRDREAGAGPGPGGEAGDGQHQPDDSRRSQLIAAAQARWISTLTDLGGRNTLLYYKDRRAGTLDLAGADPDMLERFCRTGSVRLTRLFGDADLRADAIRRVQRSTGRPGNCRRNAASAPPTWPPGWRGGTSCSWNRPRRCCSAA
jgi:hypothetical protein